MPTFSSSQEENKQSALPDEPSTPAQEILSSSSLSTSELEEIVTQTVAPATPSYDTESSSTTINSASGSESHSQASNYVLSSVILIPPSNPAQIQSSQGSQEVKESTYSDAVLPTKQPEILSSVVDSV